jgi:hypothetical protein
MPQVERDRVPEWARSPEAGTAAQVAAEAMSGEPKITQPQRQYLLDLIQKKQVKPDQQGKLDLIMKCLRISEDPEEYGMSRSKASELIDWFKKQPDKPKMFKDQQGERFAFEVPAGRYAVEAENGQLRFYHVWVSRDKKRLHLYVLHGPDESDLKYQNTIIAILGKIKKVGVRECAIRYGLEIGSCSNCGRRLTNHISRALGIGPVCGGRMFGESEWRVEVNAKRAELVSQGINPDEELE